MQGPGRTWEVTAHYHLPQQCSTPFPASITTKKPLLLPLAVGPPRSSDPQEDRTWLCASDHSSGW